MSDAVCMLSVSGIIYTMPGHKTVNVGEQHKRVDMKPEGDMESSRCHINTKSHVKAVACFVYAMQMVSA